MNKKNNSITKIINNNIESINKLSIKQIYNQYYKIIENGTNEEKNIYLKKISNENLFNLFKEVIYFNEFDKDLFNLIDDKSIIDLFNSVNMDQSFFHDICYSSDKEKLEQIINELNNRNIVDHIVPINNPNHFQSLFFKKVSNIDLLLKPTNDHIKNTSFQFLEKSVIRENNEFISYFNLALYDNIDDFKKLSKYLYNNNVNLKLLAKNKYDLIFFIKKYEKDVNKKIEKLDFLISDLGFSKESVYSYHPYDLFKLDLNYLKNDNPYKKFYNITYSLLYSSIYNGENDLTIKLINEKQDLLSGENINLTDIDNDLTLMNENILNVVIKNINKNQKVFDFLINNINEKGFNNFSNIIDKHNTFYSAYNNAYEVRDKKIDYINQLMKSSNISNVKKLYEKMPNSYINKDLLLKNIFTSNKDIDEKLDFVKNILKLDLQPSNIQDTRRMSFFLHKNIQFIKEDIYIIAESILKNPKLDFIKTFETKYTNYFNIDLSTNDFSLLIFLAIKYSNNDILDYLKNKNISKYNESIKEVPHFFNELIKLNTKLNIDADFLNKNTELFSTLFNSKFFVEDYERISYNFQISNETYMAHSESFVNKISLSLLILNASIKDLSINSNYKTQISNLLNKFNITDINPNYFVIDKISTIFDEKLENNSFNKDFNVLKLISKDDLLEKEFFILLHNFNLSKIMNDLTNDDINKLIENYNNPLITLDGYDFKKSNSIICNNANEFYLWKNVKGSFHNKTMKNLVNKNSLIDNYYTNYITILKSNKNINIINDEIFYIYLKYTNNNNYEFILSSILDNNSSYSNEEKNSFIDNIIYNNLQNKVQLIINNKFSKSYIKEHILNICDNINSKDIKSVYKNFYNDKIISLLDFNKNELIKINNNHQFLNLYFLDKIKVNLEKNDLNKNNFIEKKSNYFEDCVVELIKKDDILTIKKDRYYIENVLSNNPEIIYGDNQNSLFLNQIMNTTNFSFSQNFYDKKTFKNEKFIWEKLNDKFLFNFINNNEPNIYNINYNKLLNKDLILELDNSNYKIQDMSNIFHKYNLSEFFNDSTNKKNLLHFLKCKDDIYHYVNTINIIKNNLQLRIKTNPEFKNLLLENIQEKHFLEKFILEQSVVNKQLIVNRRNNKI